MASSSQPAGRSADHRGVLARGSPKGRECPPATTQHGNPQPCAPWAARVPEMEFSACVTCGSSASTTAGPDCSSPSTATRSWRPWSTTRSSTRPAGRTDGTAGREQQDTATDRRTDRWTPRSTSCVRAGESPTELAEAAGVDVERVVRFARPVLQEREHVAAAAQQVVVRTGALDGPLGEVVADRLEGVVSDADASWDAWRREDGRWVISLNFRDDVQRRTARWSFDPATVAEVPAAVEAPASFDDVVSTEDVSNEDVADEIADELAALGLQPVAA